jgi:hypothetical protein
LSANAFAVLSWTTTIARSISGSNPGLATTLELNWLLPYGDQVPTLMPIREMFETAAFGAKVNMASGVGVGLGEGVGLGDGVGVGVGVRVGVGVGEGVGVGLRVGVGLGVGEGVGVGVCVGVGVGVGVRVGVGVGVGVWVRSGAPNLEALAGLWTTPTRIAAISRATNGSPQRDTLVPLPTPPPM